MDVSTINGVTVSQTASLGYAIHQFKETHGTTTFSVTWVGKSNRAAALSPVYLQLFNVTTLAWETVASNSSAAANTDIILSVTKLSNLTDYYDGSNYVSARVYQEAV